MPQYLLMCRSLTYAQRASRLLERSGITAIITRTPRTMAESGCGYCVKVSEKRLAVSIKILNEAGLGPVRIFLLSSDGSVIEVTE